MQAGEGNTGQGLQAVAMRSSLILGVVLWGQHFTPGLLGTVFNVCFSLWLSLETATWVFNIF